ncbi:acyl carrier protein [Marininema halotolerans]|uniref:Phosphopantetheine attachment site n=1 Tax=Marininema halotolerans TaxID=1155944 RepID=A0A1I6PW86_9BACL|nr:acyl carrier protein [Marininema halotolerans]SFS44459.1 Phosphopantetheine attachment site [Marininema halotolerans]
MVETTVELIIHHYIAEHVDETFDYDTEIFEEGLVNSLFAIQLMTFLEKEFGIKITMDDLDMDNYKSIHAIGEFVRRRQERDER